MNFEKVKSKALEVISQLDWTLIPEQIKQKTQEIIDLGDSEYDKIVAIPSEERTFENKRWSMTRGRRKNERSAFFCSRSISRMLMCSFTVSALSPSE